MTQATNPTPIQKYLTLEDYLAYDDGTDTRYELVSGKLVEMPSESDINGLIVVILMFALSRFVRPDRFRIRTEIAVSGYRATVRVPDLMVLTEEAAAALQGAARSILLPDMPPPALVVEVVSPGIENEQRDYRYKRSEYAAREIQEYWIVDPAAEQVMVLTWVAGLYEEAVFKGEQRIVSALFPELQLTASQILQAKMD
ncbi:Uma2 family endonuclease [Leptothermofonsia sichuanensis E412]|uniref:Uma2 family endonuclease n=1 Tax=Leptothermofonsia sichuanensis TaxID=2917832 RepID=UPI001CA68AD3|nr:Uma2 family endonuclease [Leptothermofonsia sichuanensis]QZZ22522.1 Uma2 family endonuclease [Leptothermofonsia sichuanensis E412]